MSSSQRSGFLVALIGAGLLYAPSARTECNGGSSNEVVGTVAGAVIGGLLGSAFGSGRGKAVAIGAGVVAGGFLGNRFGASLDCDDQRYHSETAQESLETRQVGSTSTWRNPDSGHFGSVTPLQTYQREDGTPCREFEQSVTVEGRTETGRGTACREPDARWKVVQAPTGR